MKPYAKILADLKKRISSVLPCFEIIKTDSCTGSFAVITLVSQRSTVQFIRSEGGNETNVIQLDIYSKKTGELHELIDQLFTIWNGIGLIRQSSFTTFEKGSNLFRYSSDLLIIT
jgi:hypothetical protein